MAQLVLNNVGISFDVHHGNSRSLQLALYTLLGFGRRPTDAPAPVQALDRINLRIGEGERVAIIGHNGAGKTTLLRVLSGVYPPTKGRIKIEGSISSLTDITLGMDVEASGHDNIMFRSVFMGMSFREARENAAAIADFTELGDALQRPVRTYSTGMYLRLAFAISTSIFPDILVLDEMINAGDAAFQAKARRRVEELLAASKILVVSTHDDNTVLSLCNRAVWLDQGRVMVDGDARQVLEVYHSARKNLRLVA